MVIIVKCGAYIAIMHNWFYLRVGDDVDDDHIEMHSNFEFTRKIPFYPLTGC